MRLNSPLPSEIHTEAANYVRLREQLLSEIPDLDEGTLCGTLEGLSDLNEMLAELIRSALDDEGLKIALSTRLSDMHARLERLDRRACKKRRLAIRLMTDAAIRKISVADFTASLKQSGPTVTVVDEALIPPAYWRPQPPKLDKLAILNALKSGAAIDGALLSSPTYQLSVRTK
jgi:hypothetical protein